MQGLSATAEGMVYCTKAFLFASMAICQLQPRLSSASSLQSRQSMRGMLNSWLAWAAIALFRCR